MNTELSDFFEIVMPGEIRSYVDNVAAGYTALAGDMKASHAMEQAQTQAWLLLLSNFKKFYDGVGFLSTLSISTLRTAEEYARLLTQWRDIYQKASGRVATGATVTIPSDGVQASLNTLLWIVGLGVAAYSLSVVKPFVQTAAFTTRRRRLA